MIRLSKQDRQAASIILVLLVLFTYSHSSAKASEGSRSSIVHPDVYLQQAQALLKNEQPGEALKHFQKLIESKQLLLPALFGAADAMAMLEQPEEGLAYYQQALSLSEKGSGEERRALFGIARMLIWLERYEQAEKTYRQILTKRLASQDQDIAQAGLIGALSLQDKPMLAYHSVTDKTPLMPAGRFERARAALWAGWPDRAQDILKEPIDVHPDSRLARDIRNLKRDVANEIGNPLDIQYYFSQDSDDFNINRTDLSVGKRFNDMKIAGIRIQVQSFNQADKSLNMLGVQGSYAQRFLNRFWLSLLGGPAYYGDWDTASWSSNVVYRPNDFMRAEANISREVVETFKSFDLHLLVNTASVALDYRATNRLTLVGAIYGQRFSDDNKHLGTVDKIVLLLSRRIGLSTVLRFRYFDSSRNDVIGYFNPESFAEEQALLSIKRHIIPNWRFEVIGGGGYQHLKPGENGTTALVQGHLFGNLGHYCPNVESAMCPNA